MLEKILADLYFSRLSCSSSAAVVADTSSSKFDKLDSPEAAADDALESLGNLGQLASIVALRLNNNDELEGLLSSFSTSHSMLDIDSFSSLTFVF